MSGKTIMPRLLLVLGALLAAWWLVTAAMAFVLDWRLWPLSLLRRSLPEILVDITCVILCVIVWSKGKRRRLMLAGISLGSLALVLQVVEALGWWRVVPAAIAPVFLSVVAFEDLRLVVSTTAWWLGHLALLALIRPSHRSDRVLLRWLPHIAGFCLLLSWHQMFCPRLLEQLADWPRLDDWTIRPILLVALPGLALCSLVLVVRSLFEWLTRLERSQALIRGAEVQLVCPRCGTSFTLREGRGECSGCRLGVAMRLDEPRCECGYSLLDLKSGNCPECGRPIGAAGATAPGRP